MANAWHYNPHEIKNAPRKGTEDVILQLFPDFKGRGLRLQLKYQDSFAGTIVLDANGDLQAHKVYQFFDSHKLSVPHQCESISEVKVKTFLTLGHSFVYRDCKVL